MFLIKKLQAEVQSDVLPLKLINAVLADKSSDAQKSWLKRACQKGDLIRVQNGLYLIGNEQRYAPYHSFVIANHMRVPSYISLESALSFYGLIPEAVYTTTSVTTKSSVEKNTPIGQFSFSYLKTKYFNFGFYQYQNSGQKFLIATPLKALLDYIVLKKKVYQSINDLVTDLRFDMDEFKTFTRFVNKKKITEMLEIYKSYRLQRILKELRNVL